MKLLKIAFAICLAASAAISLLLFFSWNNYKTVPLPNFDAKPEFASIDKCSFNEKYLSVNGWAFDKNNPNAHAIVYAKKHSSDEWIIIKSSIENRPDVSNFFKANNMYDRAGFNASIRNINYLGGLSGDIAVVINDDKGNARGIRYECK
ncbi:hypothetical protein [Pantoea sp.]|uniref:hypothetical protein n=1 Tax=Pantoea sp. TaxID=69393 RepID=UPI0031D14F9A